ncbi:NAD-dependent epimerase/dehydratase family protein [Actinomycetospora sp. CA-101289]|uniref:NAD-dependent epimerase/dehydratase family protein n=1 Tax=Actinomycetospora sp. CA-101289 TaxID=3239893 RepID=UPI003D951484
MKVLVTGSTGFVGHAVAAEMVDRGHQVVGVTRTIESALPPGVARFRGDISRVEDLTEALSGVDAVCHLAARTRARESISDPLGFWTTNVGGTLTLLRAMLTVGTTRLVLASTCAVYGQADHQPLDESAPEVPANPYGESKLAADRSVLDVAATGAIGAVILRPCNAAGASHGRTDHDTSRLIPGVVAALRSPSAEVVIDGDGDSIRDFVHVADVADAFALSLDSCSPGTVRTYNIGSERKTSVLDVIEVAERASGNVIRRRHGPEAPGPRELRADSSRIRAELGWRPRRSSLERILGDVLDADRRAARDRAL